LHLAIFIKVLSAYADENYLLGVYASFMAE